MRKQKNCEDLLPLTAVSYIHDTNNKLVKNHNYNSVRSVSGMKGMKGIWRGISREGGGICM